MIDGTRCVMMLDDATSPRETIHMLLRPTGLAIRRAADTSEALDLLSGESVDLVLVDLHQSGPHGVDLVRAIRETPRGRIVPVLVLTADWRGRFQEDLTMAGATAVLQKPSPPLVIRNQVLELLGMPVF
ncbi:MAG: response regulator [Candidatus Brocadiae bacterium]|nr:response regulator [Candidatus Brocadiia bacterium]